MAITTDIGRAWRHPRRVVAGLRARGRSEPFAFSLLVLFLLLAFVAQWPGLSRAAYLQPDVTLVQRLVAAGLGLLASIPVAYLAAAGSRVLARLMGGQGDWYGARLALFWSLVAVSPAMLFQGLIAGFIGAGPALDAVGVGVLAAFAYLWLNALAEMESPS